MDAIYSSKSLISSSTPPRTFEKSFFVISLETSESSLSPERKEILVFIIPSSSSAFDLNAFSALSLLSPENSEPVFSST